MFNRTALSPPQSPPPTQHDADPDWLEYIALVFDVDAEAARAPVPLILAALMWQDNGRGYANAAGQDVVFGSDGQWYAFGQPESEPWPTKERALRHAYRGRILYEHHRDDG